MHRLLPDRTSHGYQPHDRILAASDDTRNFIHRLLHRNVYWPWSSHHWTLYITLLLLDIFSICLLFHCLTMVAVCQLYNTINEQILYYCISRDLTTRHQIKYIAMGWTSVGPSKNRTCWTISELNPVCHDSTPGLIVACSFCVQSAIPSALIRSPYSRGSTTAATATATRTKTRTGRRLCQQRQLQGRRIWIGNGSRGKNLRQLLRSVHRGATCWLRTCAVRT